MRAMRAEGFRGYQDLKLVDLPKPQMSEGRVLVPELCTAMSLRLRAEA
jgi:NADPH:quinone reductase-like Zn-dependent oxidoreductase